MLKDRLRYEDGSSPLTRGKRSLDGDRGERVRLIPAHAGKTTACPAARPAGRAHPRSRGENGVIDMVAQDNAGSSPLTRGKRRLPAPVRRRPGLIPAHAGKTRADGPEREQGTAHPRSRGENCPSRRMVFVVLGSSPLTRGKPSHSRRERCGGRLIPAHAGKTSAMWAIVSSQAAHPRSRGENVCELGGGDGDRGSSPLTRGKHFLTCAFTAQIGQILESLELCASSESYSSPDAYATDAP